MRWYKVTGRRDRIDGAVQAHVPPLSGYRSRDELLKACKSEIWEGIWDRKEAAERHLEGFFDFMVRNDGYMGAWTVDDLREMAGWTDDDSWRKRIDAKWPVLSLAAGGEDR